MTDLIEDYLRRVEGSLRADPERRRAIVAELRSHLEERVADVRARDAGRDPADVVREVLRDFGDPVMLALSYDPSARGPAVLKAPSGEVVLSIGRAVGRGTGKVLKFVAIAVGFLLVLGTGLGIWAFYEVKPIVEANVPYPVYDRSEHCDATGCTGGPTSQTFHIYPEAREVRMDLAVDHKDATSGTVTLRIEDPDGKVKYDRTFTAGTTRHAHEDTQWAPVRGDWKVTVTLTAFKGTLDINIFAIGLPEGAVPG